MLPAWAGCVPKPECEVVLYTSADREYSAPILDAFERRPTGLEVSRLFDVEASKTVGLVTRIMEESSHPRCDVFWNNEVMHTIRLQRAGLLRVRRWPVPDSWPKGMRASDGTWLGVAARARVILINRSRLTQESDAPTSVMELSDPRWRKKCGVAFPGFGTTATHFAVLADQLGQEKSDVWFQEVASNAVILSGNKQVALAVSSGQLDWGLTDTDDATVEVQNGHQVRWLFPDQGSDQMGALFIPNTVAVLEKAPHPVNAGVLADYLTSQSVENRLTMDGSSHYSIWAMENRSHGESKSVPLKRLQADFERAADQWERLSKQLPNWFQ
jgi:iron(III) transport system substrate-binding protein